MIQINAWALLPLLYIVVGLVLSITAVLREKNIPKDDVVRGFWFWLTLLLWPSMILITIVMGFFRYSGTILRRVFKTNSMINMEEVQKQIPVRG